MRRTMTSVLQKMNCLKELKIFYITFDCYNENQAQTQTQSILSRPSLFTVWSGTKTYADLHTVSNDSHMTHFIHFSLQSLNPMTCPTYFIPVKVQIHQSRRRTASSGSRYGSLHRRATIIFKCAIFLCSSSIYNSFKYLQFSRCNSSKC